MVQIYQQNLVNKDTKFVNYFNPVEGGPYTKIYNISQILLKIV